MGKQMKKVFRNLVDNVREEIIENFPENTETIYIQNFIEITDLGGTRKM